MLGLSGVMAASIFALKSPWQQNYSVKLTRRSDGHVLKPYAKCRLTPSKGIGSLDLRRMSMSPQPYLRVAHIVSVVFTEACCDHSVLAQLCNSGSSSRRGLHEAEEEEGEDQQQH